MQQSFLQPSYGATKVQGTRLPVISFIFAQQSRALCKAIFIYVSVYLSGFEHSMYT